MAGIAAGVVCTMLLLAYQPHPSLYFSRSAGALGGTSSSLSIQGKLQKQEDVYEAMVQSRHALIRKYGPTPEKLEAFPKVGSWAKYMLWDFFPASYNCPYETERVGVLGDGGKWVCGLSRLVDKPNCVVYSAGISTESSFEAELVKRTKCEVFGFDFSVQKFGPEVENYGSIRQRTHFYPYGISGHTFIDILKVDIEGSEFDTLTSMIKYFKERGRPLPFGQLQLEIHADKITFAQFLKWWEDLEEAGLRPFWTEPNLLYTNWFRNAPSYTEYSFLNVGGNHDIIRG
ncbi:methyltransferase domain protein [Ceratobasidium sp. AG-Ba]|nr:methyltransferase domain protein [Ceratobasidium sp. AG-Ba]